LFGALSSSALIAMAAQLQCVWFKRDLRLLDHAALFAAAERGAILPLYIIEPAVIHGADFDGQHWQFIAQALSDLQSGLRQLGVDLLIEQGSAVAVFDRLQRVHYLSNIWSHEETGNAVTYQRDLDLAKWAELAGVGWHEIPQNGVVRRLADRDGWSRIWQQRMNESLTPVPSALSGPNVVRPTAAIPTVSELGIRTDAARAVDLIGGESQALMTLESFIHSRGHRYQREMSSPNTAFESCSRLSPYLAWGCISMRTVVQAVQTAAGQGRLPKMAARAFLSRCHWHCHFIQKLESEPAIEFRAFNAACDDLRGDPPDLDRFEAWKAGRTGYPFVDACMRALRARGWINFRMRAMLVSFAAYHLWLDWRVFRDWLACQFIDYEPGIHYSQIQMQSGLTGINSLRIYNPVKQGQDHDPQGHFIRRWVPELAELGPLDIHQPWKMPELMQYESSFQLGVTYPNPIVDHQTAVRFVRDRFTQLRQRADYWQHSQVVLQRHGSRKRSEKARSKRKPEPSSDQSEFSFD
jgi:deoxyribodipyrimidine photo-lyase